jgi:hypothetical protein
MDAPPTPLTRKLSVSLCVFVRRYCIFFIVHTGFGFFINHPKGWFNKFEKSAVIPVGRHQPFGE